jgi:hypothetical protein
MNTPYMGINLYAAPMSNITDGTNDVVMLGQENNRVQLTALLLCQDEGNFFDKDGQVSKRLGLKYLKCTKWNLKPLIKGPDDKLEQDMTVVNDNKGT